MKKILAIVLCISVLLTGSILASCSADNNGSNPLADKIFGKQDNVADENLRENTVETNTADINTVETNTVEPNSYTEDDVHIVMAAVESKKVNTAFAQSVKEKLAIDKEAEAVIEEARNIESDNPLTGDWRLAMDLSTYFNESFAAEGLETNFSEFNVAILLAITEDRIVMTLDMDSIEQDVQEFGEEVIALCGDIIIAELEANDYTVEEFEAVIGMSLEEYLDSVEELYMTEVAYTLEELAGAYTAEVYEYETEGNKLIFSDGSVNTYKIVGDTLTLSEDGIELVFAREGSRPSSSVKPSSVVVSQDNSVLGNWNASIDMSDMIGEMFESAYGMEFELDPWYVPVVIEITSDTWKLAPASPDKISLDMESFIDALLNNNIDAIIEFSAEGNGVSAEQLLEAMELQGISKSDFADMMKAEIEAYMDYDELAAGLYENVSIEIDGNYILQEDGSTIEYKLNGNSLKLYNPKDIYGNDVETYGIYPMSLTRA